MKTYYYLEGQEKLGPFSEEDFLKLNLNSETFIWTEGLTTWKPLKEFPDLINKIPPPLPDKVLNIEKKIKKSNKDIYSVVFVLLLLLISFALSYIIIEAKETKLKNELTVRIDRIFKGKLIVCDGVNYLPEGRFENSIFFISDDDNRILEHFILNSGGFTFLKLKKVDSGYELETNSSSNIGFFSKNNNKKNALNKYNDAYDYFIRDNDGCYISSHYEIITNFPNLRNEYFYIENKLKPSFPNSTHWWSESYLTYNNCKVYYKTDCRYYEISKFRNATEEDWVKYLSFFVLLSIVSFLFVLIKNPFNW